MSWKDYLYFERRDKNAVILLLILIVLGGIIYVLVRNNNQKVNSEKELSFQSELNSSENNLENNREKLSYHSDKLKAGATVELNSADTTELKKIPGIGSVYAGRIIKYRNSLGGYVSLDQLKEVWGVDDDLYNKIRPYLTVEENPKKLKVNSLKFDQLKSHPYLNYKQVKVITDLRERKGNLTSINRLSLLEEFTEKDIDRLKPYLSFD